MAEHDPADVELLSGTDRDLRWCAVSDALLPTQVLDALAGRLLPPGGQSEMQWGTKEGDLGILHCSRVDCSRASEHTHRRTEISWPDGSVYTGAWQEVSDE